MIWVKEISLIRILHSKEEAKLPFQSKHFVRERIQNKIRFVAIEIYKGLIHKFWSKLFLECNKWDRIIKS